MNNIVDAQIMPAERDGHGLGCGECLVTVGDHRADMQVWLTRAAGVPNAPKELSRQNPLVAGHDKASSTQMAEEDLDGAAAEQNMVAGRMFPVHVARVVVGQPVFESFDCTCAWTPHTRVEAGIVAQPSRCQTSRTIPKSIQSHDVDRMSVGWKPMMKRIQHQTVTTLKNCVVSGL